MTRKEQRAQWQRVNIWLTCIGEQVMTWGEREKVIQLMEDEEWPKTDKLMTEAKEMAEAIAAERKGS